MELVDLLIVLIYIAGLFGFAMYIGLKETAEDFLVLSRKAPFVLVLFSVISTWVGIGTTVATAASGFDTGISLAVTAATGALVGVIAASLFAPVLKNFGDRFGAHTIGDFFAIRYSGAVQLLVAALILVIYLLLTAAQFVALAALLDVWGGVGFNIAVLLAAGTTVIYTAFAGIKSDFYTDVIHFLVMVVVLFGVLLPITLDTVGGFGALASLPPSFFEPFAYGGASFFVAGIIFGAGMVFVTMEIWQRIYAADSATTARWAIGVSGIGIIAFYAVSAFFGMATRMISPDLVDRDQALFVLMAELLPRGLLGLGIAAFMAVFISSVNSMLMVGSATIAKDFYKGLLRRNAEDSEVLRVARVATFVIGVVGLAIAFVVPDVVSLSVNSLFMLLVLFPAVIGGFFWRRATAKAAMASVVGGFLVVVGFMALDPATAFLPGFLASAALFIGISKVTSHEDSENVDIRRTPVETGTSAAR